MCEFDMMHIQPVVQNYLSLRDCVGGVLVIVLVYNEEP
jgi:hypothetical protein